MNCFNSFIWFNNFSTFYQFTFSKSLLLLLIIMIFAFSSRYFFSLFMIIVNSSRFISLFSSAFCIIFPMLFNLLLSNKIILSHVLRLSSSSVPNGILLLVHQ